MVYEIAFLKDFSIVMKVIRADVLGFCMGVKRAVDLADKTLLEAGSKKVYSLGPLIHNPTVLADFEKRGLSVLSDDKMSCVQENSLVLIRAHGTTPEVMVQLESRNCTVVDATCARVHLSQKRAEEWSGKGYQIIIAGDRNHGEVTSIAGFATKCAGSSVVIVQNAKEAQEISVAENSVLIAQTTFSPVEFARIKELLMQKNPELVVFNSICFATMERQKALKNLQGRVEGILVIGGKTSANTRRLYETACSVCSKAALIENVSEIPDEFFCLQNVGITAGASTPEAVIQSVEKALLF